MVRFISSGSSLPDAEAADIAGLGAQPIEWSSSPDWHRRPLRELKNGDRIGGRGKLDRAPLGAIEETKKLSTQETESETAPVTDLSQGFTPIFLSAEQTAVLDLVVNQKLNVFFTGAAGTGKSVLLRRLISDLRALYGDNVAVTASTGIAACNIGGTTLHSFAGIGLGKEPAEELVSKIRRNRKNASRWRSVRVLIIDEVSMINAELLDKLDHIGRTLRRAQRDQPFGGIQLVLTGDFFQLPPVDKDQPGRARPYAFNAACWSGIVNRTILLTQVFRQKDERFANMLNEMRQGHLSPDTEAVFKSLGRAPLVPDGIVPTQLYPLRGEVDRANRRALSSLEGKIVDYKAEDEVDRSLAHVKDPKDLLVNLMAPETLSLKLGAQVMMIKNVDDTLVNGSLGRVIGFMSSNTYSMLPKVLHERVDEDGCIGYTQIEDYDVEYANSVFSAPPPTKTEGTAQDRRKRAKLHNLKEMTAAEQVVYPLVRFHNIDGTTRDVLVRRESWTITDADGNDVAKRSQLPLILAWALSIHKSQGQTLDWVKVDLRNVFEVGQAYVAISRATTLDGLQIFNFSAQRVSVDASVLEFYETLETFKDMPRQTKMDEFFGHASAYKRSEHFDRNRPKQGGYVEKAELGAAIEQPKAKTDTILKDAPGPQSIDDVHVDQNSLSGEYLSESSDIEPHDVHVDQDSLWSEYLSESSDVEPDDFDTPSNFIQPSRRFHI